MAAPDGPNGMPPGGLARDVDMYASPYRPGRQMPAALTLLIAMLLGVAIGGAASYTLRLVNM